MKDTPRKPDGAFDMDAPWECEQCRKTMRFGDSCLSWCLQIICAECEPKESESTLSEIVNELPTNEHESTTQRASSDL